MSDGLRVIVTGSASGLGAAAARRLAKDGARLVINYASNKHGADETADVCRAAGAEVTVVQGDVARDEDCRRIASAAKWDGLDALINNAGTTVHVAHDKMDDLSAKDFQRIYAVNTIGPYQMIRAARAQLEASTKPGERSSSVVNVSSIAGLSGIGSSVAYVASKGALNAMTLSLSRALAPLIRVNAVCPGYIDTPWFEKGRGEDGAQQLRAQVRDKTPLKLASGPDDVAKLICFLAGQDANHITGELMRIDAGLHLL